MKSGAALLRVAGGVVLCAALLGATAPGVHDENDIRARLAAYAPVRLQADLSGLGAREREALGKIVTAVDAVDEIYWKQMGRQALETRRALAAAASPVERLYRDFLFINYGPFDIRRDNERFTAAGSSPGPRLPGAGFFPEDMTKDEFE
ncbi:MAG: hypothetical protein AAB249_05545, partial [Acidobacteriota bacterium]